MESFSWKGVKEIKGNEWIPLRMFMLISFLITGDGLCERGKCVHIFREIRREAVRVNDRVRIYAQLNGTQQEPMSI